MTRRAAVASAKKIAAQPLPSSSYHSIAARPLGAIGSSSGNILTNKHLLPASTLSSSSVTLTSLSFGLSQLTLQNNHQLRPRTLSSLAEKNQPLGEPITFLTLNKLRDNPGAVKKKRRVGRGIGSSKGKTCGRGHKGQKARAGKGVHPTFEGGQTKFYKRLPKIGKMKNAKFRLELIPLNVGKVQDFVTMGRLVPARSDGVITIRDFVNAGMFPASSVKSGVKLLGDGKERLTSQLLIEVPWASASAIDAIESKGGFVTTVHYNRLAMRALLKPQKFPMKPEAMLEAEKREEASGDDDGVEEEEQGEERDGDIHDMHLLPRRARPPPKYMPYYTNYEKRGYLNPRVQLERKKRGLKDILLSY